MSKYIACGSEKLDFETNSKSAANADKHQAQKFNFLCLAAVNIDRRIKSNSSGVNVDLTLVEM